MLESYIAPLFTGYVDKYIKNLKPEDLSLSLWGGDLVLQNLEINLDILQQELNLPVEFLSGKIHKFQLHVPWTRLNYDPVVITINTMEFIVKLKDTNDSVLSSSEDDTANDETEKESSSVPDNNAEDLPPGYVQSILNKVMNNVTFKIQNIIIKYVEDDMVFSLNIKSLDLHSADENWDPSFVELKLPQLLLRKICQISDLTICLDQRNPSGKIELYQDPVLYKCNLSCRLVSSYKSLNSFKPYENMLNVYCESFDFSFTDLQVPMVIRLIKLVIGLYYGNLDLPGCNTKLHTAPKVLDQHRLEHTRSSNTSLDNAELDVSNDSWTSWALSMVPGMGAVAEENKASYSKLKLKTTIGIYITLVTVTIKKTNTSQENVFGHQRLEFSPVLCFEVSGSVIECNIIGDLLFDLSLGLKTVVGYTISNQCVCSSLCQEVGGADGDEDSISEDNIFLKVTGPSNEDEALSFLEKSLFESYVKSTSEMVEPVQVESLDTESSKDYNFETNRLFEKAESYSDSDPKEISEKFGGVFFNYFYEMYLPNLLSGEYENIFLYPDIDEKVKEVSKKRINIDSCQLYISTDFVHFLLWFVGIATNNIPERKKKTAVVLDSFVLGQLEIGNLLSREFIININDLETHLMTKEHEYSKFGCSSSQNEKEALLFKLKNLELLKVEPMYPVEFVSMVEKGKLVKLHKVENLNVQVTLKVNGVEAGISNLSMETLESVKHILLEPTDCEASLTYSLLPDTCVTKSPCIKAESTFKCTKTSIIFTKVQAVLFYLITMSWITQQKLEEINIIASSIFHDPSTLSSPLMNIQLQGLVLRFFDMADLAGISGVVSSMLTTLEVIGEDKKEEQTTIFQAPFATSKLHDFETWLMQDVSKSELEPFIQLKLQFQKENCKLVDTAIPLLGIKIAGVSVNVDQLLHTWLTHIVDNKVKRKAQQSREKGLLNRSVTTSTQRRTKSYARVFGSGSVSSHSRHEKYVENLPPSEDLSPVKDTHTSQDEHYAEWFAKKMNFFKLFHLQIDIEPTVIVLPTDSWHSGFETFQDLVQLVSRSFKGDALSSNALVVCLPKFLLSSASDGIDIFEFNLPMILKQKRKSNETFPWTINCKDLTVFALFPEKNDTTYNEKIETIYICKPFSWTVYLASSTQSSGVSKSIANLGIIPETDVSALTPSGKVVSSNIMQEKIGNHLTGKSALGFVLHMDCSICECFVWQKQLFLISSIVTKVYNICNSVAVMEADKDDTPSGSCAGTTKTNNIAGSTKGSISTASIVDQAEAMSTITGSSNAFTNTKSLSDAFDVSLWIQCTLPKVKCTVLSFSNDNSTIYQVTSEIDEIMFAFDYKDKVLELTNKIADCVIYYSLLRFDNEPAGWMVIDNNYLLSYSDIHHSSHVESKTLLSIIYRRTYQHSTSILSPEESDSYKKLEDLDQSSSNAGLIQEEHITKHELYVNILPLDLICFSKPILSSLNVFTQLLPDILKNQASTTGTEPDQLIVVDQYISVMTLPLLDIHCDSLRVIIPVGEVALQKNYCCIDNTESVFLFHFQSLDLHSSPINPIGKTVIDRSTYRQVKQSYKDVLKRLKLWNVQYQLDLSNIGLCTTNWQSLESSLPGKRPDLQNPALEWNSHPGYGQQVMTPIFPGFDFKATIAPPIISKSTGQLHSCTAAAFEFHSPKEIKIFLNTNQVELALDFVHEINTLVLEVTQLLQESFPNRKSSGFESDFTPPKGHSETKITNDDFFLPSIELFSSVSCISIALYTKKFEQPLISTINPAFFINIMQPTFSFASVKEVKVQLKLHNLEIISSSNPSGISCESPVPLLGDFDLPLLSCGVGYKDPITGAISSLINISTYFEKLDDVSLDIRFEKPLFVQYNFALDENIKLFIGNVNKVLDKNIVKENKDDGISKEDLQCVEKSGQLAFRIKTIYFASKRIYASLSASENTNDVSINTSCQEIKTHADVVYSLNDDSVDTVNIECQLSGADIYFVESGNKSLLLMPCNLDVNFAFDFSLHSGNNLHKSSLPKIYLYLECGLLQLHVNQQLYRLILDLSSKMSNMMAVDNTERNTDGLNAPKKDVGNWCLGLEKSEDDLRNGSFKYNVLEEDEMTPQDNELFFTDDHYSFSPIIMWKYPQPRVVTDLSVLPVPFHISNEVEAGSRKLPCLLQYWDKLNGRFVTSIQFFVSENESSSNTVVEEQSIASVECSSAKIWRVIIGVSKDTEYIDDEHDDDDGEYDGDATTFSPPELSVVPASSLVACMKVNSVYSPKLIPSIELKSSFAKLRLIFSSSDLSLGTGSPSDFSPFYLEKETYPDLIEAIEIVFDDLHWSASLTNNLRIVFEVVSKFQINLIDFNNLCWLKFFDVYQVYAKTSQNLVGGSSVDKLALELDLGATEMFLTQTSMHTLMVTSQAWMNIMNEEPDFLLFHHYILCNETDEIIHLQQINTDEDIILHSGQMYPYSWSSNSSKLIHFCLNAPGDWKWSEPLSLDQVGILPRKLEHKKLTSLVFVEVKKISGIQFQIIFHGSCSLKNLLDFDLKLCFEINETLFSTIHPTVVNKISKEFVIQAGTTRPSLCISPSFIKSIGFSKHITESNVSQNQFVISIPQQEDDSHFTIQIQDGKKSLLCWLSFDYTSDIMGQLVVTISPKFIFRNHFPHPIYLKAVEKDSSAYVEMDIPGKGKESQVFDLFPERWYDLFFSIQSSYSATGISLNSSMYQSIKEIDQNISDKELNESNWPFIQGTELSSLTVSDSGMYNWFEHIEFEDAQDIHMAKKIKHHNKCSFQYTLPNSSTPTILIDIKPHVLLTNMADMDVFVNTDDNCIKQQTSTSLAPIQDLKVGISVGERVIWSPKLGISTKTLQQVSKQKMLAPDTVTHCSIIDDIRKRSYQLSFSCRKVHEMLCITISKRFVLHNLSNSHLMMTPLIFSEFKREHVFEQISAIQIPPKSDASFSMLNLYTTLPNQVPDGMALNFQLTANDLKTNSNDEIQLNEYRFTESDSLLLSNEHLRETLFLSDENSDRHPFVLTSGLDSGIVHVYVDEDSSVVVEFHNHCELDLMMKEHSLQSKHAEVFSTDISSMTMLLSKTKVSYQPLSFKESFPKTDNTLKINCQFSLFSGDAAELSQPITIKEDTSHKLFIPNYGEIYVKARVNSCKLYVDVDTVDNEKTMVVSKHSRVPLFNFTLSSINAVLIDFSNHEVMMPLLSAFFSKVVFKNTVIEEKSTFSLTCGFLQFDNQVTSTLDHFPVLFLPLREVSERYHSMTEDVPFLDVEASLEEDTFTLTFELDNSPEGGCFVDNIRFKMQPCEMYIEDTMIYRLANVFYTYLPRRTNNVCGKTKELEARCLSVLHPLRLHNIEIEKISILLSFHASVKVFLAADHIPLVFSPLKVTPTMTVTKEFIRFILYTYATQALVRVGWILGSFNIIGSPTGLIQSIGHGLTDFFVLPYNGLIRGPTAFVSGLSLGMTSLMRHFSTGALTSINNVTSSISRNMDRLSFDDLHLIMQEENRAESPTKVSKGFSKAFEVLGMSFLGAVAGIVDHPIQNVTEAQNTSEVLSGIATGFAKGVVGMFTKPIGGAMEFLSQASQGILQGAGLVKIPMKIYSVERELVELLVGRESKMKYMHFVPSESYAQLFVAPAKIIRNIDEDKEKECYSGVLVLTDSTLLIYNSDISQVASIISLTEVELVRIEDESMCRLQIKKHANEQQINKASLDENPNFRQFFDSFRDAAVASHTEVLCQNLSAQSDYTVTEAQLDPIFGDLLLTLCEGRKTYLFEETCIVECVDL